MTAGPDDDRRPSAEPSFADVLNNFSFDSGRSPRRRRWGRKRSSDVEQSPRSGTAAPAAAPAPVAPAPAPARPWLRPADGRDDAEPLEDPAAEAAAVRPYAWTRGRTRSGLDLAIETLVSTNQRGQDQMAALQVEHRAVAELCEQPRSVAEIAALLSVPLGVARVLLGDMAGIGVVTVHRTAGSAGNLPDLALMERVLSGLRRL